MKHAQFEVGDINRSMTNRLKLAVERLRAMDSFRAIEGSRYELRNDQVGVVEDFVDYLEANAGMPELFCRIVLPPRTGKTVIAGQCIRAARLTTLILVPTKALVLQTARELEEQLPGTLIAIYYSEVKELTDHGINIMTYASFLELYRSEGLPVHITRSALVILDEGHHSMTEKMMKALHEVFDVCAIRLALTASPDYNENRQLAHFFPDLIHEITIREAVTMKLLAQPIIQVREIDIDASHVKITAGDFDEDEAGRLMSHALFLEEARMLRYNDPKDRERGAMVACNSCSQAEAVHQYLVQRAPEGAPPPALLLGITPSFERDQILKEFREGKIDTIVQVGVLLEGWSEPRCKILVDLAMTLSKVRATQKYFRPLTLWGDVKASIYLVIPKNLRVAPILPQDILYKSFTGEEPLVMPKKSPSKGRKREPSVVLKNPNRVEEVTVSSRTVMRFTLNPPLLNPNDDDEIREVLDSVEGFVPEDPLLFREFRMMCISHPLFQGTGQQLLRFLRLPITDKAYAFLLTRLYLERLPTCMLSRHHNLVEFSDCELDVRVFQELMRRLTTREVLDSDAPLAWRAICGPDEEDVSCMVDRALIKPLLRRFIDELLSPMEARILFMSFGLDDSEPLMQSEIATMFNISKGRVCQIRDNALYKLYKRIDAAMR